MDPIPRFSQRSLYTLSRRAGVWMRRSLLNRFVRHKTVRLIRLNGRPYKRVTLPDSHVACHVVANVAAFESREIFPRIVAVEDRELLLEYVEGRPLSDPVAGDDVDRVARFFATLYAVGRRRMKRSETRFDAELRRDLDFLRDVGVIREGLRRDLDAAFERAPAEVWVGYDYLDPLPKNFRVRPNGSLVAIDVEEIFPDQLLGRGVAKFLMKGASVDRARLLDGIARHASLDLAPAVPYVELHFLARWTKRAFLKGRHKLVDPELFEGHRS